MMDSKGELTMYLENIRNILIRKHNKRSDLTNEIITMTDLIKHAEEVDYILKEETKGNNTRLTTIIGCIACGGHGTVEIDHKEVHCHACDGKGKIKKTENVIKFWVED